MRVFRSSRPDGPYKDMNGTDAIFTSWKLNYGPNADNRGEKLLGAYNLWGFMNVGERAQGHNSVFAAEDGRTYLVTIPNSMTGRRDIRFVCTNCS